jgi:tetratricopeptide (TPR) repeat protein
LKFPRCSEITNPYAAATNYFAWLQTVTRSAAAPETENLLRTVIKKSPDDPALLSAMGYFAQRKGQPDLARELDGKALALDPNSINPSSNLAVIEAERGHSREAVKLWEDSFPRAPGQSSVGKNIARVLCEAGQVDRARDYVPRLLEFNPDLTEAKNLFRIWMARRPSATKIPHSSPSPGPANTQWAEACFHQPTSRWRIPSWKWQSISLVSFLVKKSFVQADMRPERPPS